MFRKFNMVISILALSFFAYAQHQGWNMFDNEASSSSGHSSGSRSYHK